MNEVSDRRYGAQARGPVQPQTAPPPVPEDDEIDLLGLVRTLWRGKWVIGACAALTLLIGGYYVYELAVPKYAATTTLALEVDRAQVVDLQEVVSGVSSDSQAMQTELELLKSRVLLGQVVDRLDLTTDPEFNARLRPEPRFSAEDLKNHRAAGAGPAGPGARAGHARGGAQPRDRGPGRDDLAVDPARDLTVFTIRVVTENPRQVRADRQHAGRDLPRRPDPLEARGDRGGCDLAVGAAGGARGGRWQEREDAIEARAGGGGFREPRGVSRR